MQSSGSPKIKANNISYQSNSNTFDQLHDEYNQTEEDTKGPTIGKNMSQLQHVTKQPTPLRKATHFLEN